MWDHLKDMYDRTRSKNGLVLLPKIKYKHIFLTNFSKMRVDLAAEVYTNIFTYTLKFKIKQALSESVSKALAAFGGEKAKETSLFAEMFDKFFDSLNVMNFTDGKTARKPFQDPYRSGNDFRHFRAILVLFLITNL